MSKAMFLVIVVAVYAMIVGSAPPQCADNTVAVRDIATWKFACVSKKSISAALKEDGK